MIGKKRAELEGARREYDEHRRPTYRVNCPFCSTTGSAELKTRTGIMWCVECSRCGARGSDSPTSKGAAEQWAELERRLR